MTSLRRSLALIIPTAGLALALAAPAGAVEPVLTIGPSASGTVIVLEPGSRITIVLPLLDNRAPTVAVAPDPEVLIPEPSDSRPTAENQIGRWTLRAVAAGSTGFELTTPSVGSSFILTVTVGSGRSALADAGQSGFDPMIPLVLGVGLVLLLGLIGALFLRPRGAPATSDDTANEEPDTGEVSD